MRSVPLTAASLEKYDCVLIATDHTTIDYDMVAAHAGLIVDTRNAMAEVKRPKARIVKA